MGGDADKTGGHFSAFHYVQRFLLTGPISYRFFANTYKLFRFRQFLFDGKKTQQKKITAGDNYFFVVAL